MKSRKSRRNIQRRCRFISLFLVVVMCLSGCGEKGESMDVEETDMSDTEPEVTELAAFVAPEVVEETQEAAAAEPLESEEVDKTDQTEEDIDEPEEAWDPDSVTMDESWITFGSYEQDNNLANGAEPIEWRILKQEEGRVLLMSRYGLDAKPYNETDDDVTWETCTLREWLNDEFYNSAFGEEERTLIEPTYVETADNLEAYPNTVGGNPTSDLLFLLSGEEAKEYLQIARAAQPTEYAKAQGVYIGSNGNAKAWLRSPGGAQNGAQTVTSDGVIDKQGDYNSMIYHTVCPAMWVTMTGDISAQINVKNIQVGSTVLFGHYELNDIREGAEQLEWTVLDVKDGKMLLFLENVDDIDGFNRVAYSYGVSQSFYEEIFSPQEKEYIVLTKTKPSSYSYKPNPSDIQEKYMFILNCEEAARYLVGITNAYGWLRDEAENNKYAWCLTKKGVELVKKDTYLSAIHPAMWVDTNVLQSGLTDKEEISFGSIDAVMTVTDEEKNYVTFGWYEQDNNLENGAEPIEWILLKKENGKMLLLSKYGLDAQAYHNDDSYHITWDICSLREWLNNDFYNTAFGEEEKKYIPLSEVTVDATSFSEEKVVKDYVFILSNQEAIDYVPNSEQDCEPTNYLLAEKKRLEGWLVRDARFSDRSVRVFNNKGHEDVFEPDNTYKSVRPAIWVTVNGQ